MLKPILGALVALAIMPSPAAAQDTANEDGQAAAEVVRPISIAHIDGAALRFGPWVANSGGVVEIRSPGIRQRVSGDVQRIDGVGTLDAFTVTGEVGRFFRVNTYPGTVFNANGDSMSFTTSQPGGEGFVYRIAAAGTTVAIQGQLTIGNNQASGLYTGQYQVEAFYE